MGLKLCVWRSWMSKWPRPIYKSNISRETDNEDAMYEGYQATAPLTAALTVQLTEEDVN